MAVNGCLINLIDFCSILSDLRELGLKGLEGETSLVAECFACGETLAHISYNVAIGVNLSRRCAPIMLEG